VAPQRQGGHASGRGVRDSSPTARGLEEALRAAAPRAEGGGGAKRSAEQLEIENTRLRRENDYLRQQRDILKKLWASSPNPRSTLSTD